MTRSMDDFELAFLPEFYLLTARELHIWLYRLLSNAKFARSLVVECESVCVKLMDRELCSTRRPEQLILSSMISMSMRVDYEFSVDSEFFEPLQNWVCTLRYIDHYSFIRAIFVQNVHVVAKRRNDKCFYPERIFPKRPSVGCFQNVFLA